MTYDEAIAQLALAAQDVADAIAALEGIIPSGRLYALHNRANALAVFAEDVLDQPRGHFHGSVNNQGGTDKPPPP